MVQKTGGRNLVIPALLVSGAITACAAASREAQRAEPFPAPAARSTPAGVAQARADSARHPYTMADIHFMAAMIGHHAQAIQIAGWAPTRAASAPVRILAERIINGQQDEVARMRQWLSDRRQPVPDARPGPMKMTMNGVEHAMMMPGMLTGAQLAQLERARAREFDRLFLTFMIQHHRGAVSMVKDLFSSYGAAQDDAVFKLASDVNVDQTTEIARMEKMLSALESPL